MTQEEAFNFAFFFAIFLLFLNDAEGGSYSTEQISANKLTVK